MAANAEYWRKYLDGSSPSIFPNLRDKKPRDGSRQFVPISTEGALDIKTFCKAQGIAPLSLFQVAWAIILRCYLASGVDSPNDVVFGYREEDDGWKDDAERDFVCRIHFKSRDMIGSILRFNHVSLAGHKTIGLSTFDLHSSLFNTFLVLRTTNGPLPGIIGDNGPKFDIVPTITLDEKGDVNGFLSYTTNIFSEQQANNVASTFSHVVGEIIVNPWCALDDLNLISTRDLQQLRVWNGNSPERVDSCIHHLIAERCLSQPEDLAVDSWDGTLTYQELHNLSSQLAHRLFLEGVRSEVIVPLLFEKSKWAIVGILGVMKAGAAFVMFDPSYPLSRLQTMTRDVDAKLIVASAIQFGLANSLTEKAISVSETQTYWSDAVAQGWSNPASQPMDALYICFTSGSTGKPKGILIEHAAFATRAAAAGPGMCMDLKQRVLQFASFAFHISNRDILTTLVWGGCLCIPSEEDRKNDLSSFITKSGSTWASLTPSVVRLLDPDKTPTLKLLMVAGDQMAQGTMDTWAGRVHLMNGYGPSECVGINALQTNLVTGMDCRNIGHGLGCVLWLVESDDHNKLVPIGAVGEIVIEGPAMGRGYINHPEKNKESFLPSANWQLYFRGAEPRRLYKTGDLGRYNAADGTMIFLGRKDTQAKLNGQLIELTEVEYHVQNLLSVTGTSIPDVAVDVVTPIDSDTSRLVACIETLGENRNADTCIGPPEALHESWHDLERSLEATLPRFMIPSVLMPIQPMPKTDSGKKNRKQIRNILGSLTNKELQAYSGIEEIDEVPCGESETRLQALWATALNQDAHTIGRHSNFFRLGGDSVTAMKLVSLAREIGLYLTVESVFQHPILYQQAQVCSIPNGSSLTQDQYLPFSLVDKDTRERIVTASEQQCSLSSDQIEDIYPCTPMQEGLIALTLRTPEAYTAQHVYRLGTDLVEENYKAAWMAVVDANPILRTRVVQTGEGTFQVVVRGRELTWNTWSSLGEYLAKDKANPMQLGGSLIRFGMMHNDSGQRYCVVTIHHALYDAWSLSLILNQVGRAYNGNSLLERPFAPFVKHVLYTKPESEAFWLARLRGCQATVFPALPSTRYIPSPTSSTEEIVIACDVGNHGEFTMSSRMRMAWDVTLSHYTGCDDIVFGATVSGRAATVPGVDQMTGPTIATLPTRVELSSSRKIRDLLQEIQQDFIHTIPHEQSGLSRISKLSDEALSACQFQNLLVIQSKEEELKTEWTESASQREIANLAGFGTYALTVLCQVKGNESKLFIQALFDEKVVPLFQTQRILNHFAHVLENINSNLEMPLSNIPPVSPQDMGELTAWNGTLSKSVDICVQDIIAQYFDSQPNAQAVCAWDGNFTYAELQGYSTQLAHNLLSVGLGSTAIVPICMNRSKWVPVVILGILKAGGAFTLLDPAYPIDRLRTILEEARPTMMLSNILGIASSLDNPDVPILHVPEICVIQPAEDQQVAAISTNLRDCLYVAWTSGSTGKPKGAMVSHASYASAATASKKSSGLGSESRVLQFASFAFDISVVEIVGTLMAGGCICIPSDSQRNNAIAAAIRNQRVNFVIFTPTVARLLRPADLVSVKTLMLGGEAVTSHDIRSWKDHCHVVIGYGPAECSAISTQHENPGITDGNSIGSAVGSVCWIVNPADHNTLMPIGSVGELLIEGPNVGLGYLNDTVKTKSVFIESPEWLLQFRKGQKTPLYKTGDLVQYTSGKRLRFIGRKDNQIKFHGQRFELGEVEQHIWQVLHDVRQEDAGLVEAVVTELVSPQANGRKATLVSFIQVDAKLVTTMESCKDYSWCLLPSARFTEMCQVIQSALHSRVPKHMVPTVFIPISTLPQTLSGKVDRKQMRDICSSLSESTWNALARHGTQKGRPPSTESERILYSLIKEVLDLDDIGMDDNFFYLGGDSIIAMKLGGLASEVGIQLLVEDIFKFPILARLAQTMKVMDNVVQEVSPFELRGNDESLKDALNAAIHSLGVSEDDIEDIYPCTALQEGMFALTSKSDQGNHNMYVSQSVFSLRSDIDMNRFRTAWEVTVEKNPILRTTILLGSEGTFQVVLRHFQLHWEEYEGALDEFMRQSSNIGLRIPEQLLQFALIRGDGGQRHFVMTIHHSLYDGWSLRMIFEQVEAAYNNVPPPVIPRPFISFVKYLHDLDHEQAKQFWISQLANIEAPQFPILPSTSYQPKPNQSQKRSSCRILPSSKLGVTSATVLQLAWAMTLSQYTGSNEILFGLTTSGRNAPVNGIDRIIGPTITTFPVRIRLEKSKTARELLLEMQRHVSLTIPHEHFGLQNISRVSHDAAAACRFQNLLVIQPRFDTQSEFFGERVRDHANLTGPFDSHALTLSCDLNSSKTSVDIEVSYDLNVLSHIQLSWILDQFVHLIEWIVRKPEASIEDITSVSPVLLQQLSIWNRSPPDSVRSCVHDLICGHRKTTPAAIAVSAWDGNLTYEELDSLSSRLAMRLSCEHHITPGDFVPISIEKSKWVVVAILAVWKAGGAFLLLDTSQPVHRQHTFCQKVSARVVLASATKAERMGGKEWRVISVGNWIDCLNEGNGDGHLSRSVVRSNDSAYICFTSGSTGKPKGVIIEHAMLASAATLMAEKFNISARTRAIQFASFTFDAVFADIVYTLVNGACVCIPEESESRTLAHTINQYRVNWASITPSVARTFDHKDVPGLQTLVLGGEPLQANDLATWADKVVLISGYGLTECTIDSHITPPLSRDSDPSNIGPGVGAVSWVVDPDNVDRLMPIGAPGELLLEGPIVGRGYLNEPEKTEAAFIPFPSWLRDLRQGHIGRLYRTGDLVRFSSQGDGSIQYLGRKDNQVKVRGQRIELGEVEYHLLNCFPGARAVAAEVIKPAHAGAQPLLTAFIDTKWEMANTHIPNGDNELGGHILFLPPKVGDFQARVAETRSKLGHHLPHAMIPGLFLPVSRMPLNMSKKTDRRLLREEASTLSEQKLRSYITENDRVKRRSPTSPFELTLHDFIGRLLNMSTEEFGMDDDFFRLGGDSILAMRLVGWANKCGLTLTVADIFTHPRLADLASIMRTVENGIDTVPEIPPLGLIKPEERESIVKKAMGECAVQRHMIEDIYPSTPLQEGLLALTMGKPGSYIANSEFLLSKDIDLSRWRDAWRETFEANPILRTRIIQAGQSSLQVVLKDEFIWNILDSPKDWVQQPMGFGTRLTRFTIVRRDDGQYSFTFTIHHALYDGWSLPLVLRQVEQAYQGEQLQVRPFTPFVKYLASQEHHSIQQMWKSLLHGFEGTSFPQLPSSNYIPTPETTLQHVIPTKVSVVTKANVVKLAWAVSLSQYTNSNDVVFGVTTSGRDASVHGIEQITGPTIATHPFRVTFSPDITILEAMQDVQQQSVNMIGAQHFGLQNIGRLGPDAAAACNFQNLLVIQPQTDEEFGAGDRLTPIFNRKTRNDFRTYALTLECFVSEESIRAQMHFDENLLPLEQTQRILYQFAYLLDLLQTNSPQSTLAAVDSLNLHDVSLLSQWTKDPPKRVDDLVHRQFGDVARRHPHKTAVCAWDGDFTYLQLDELSSQLAWHLQSLGAGPEIFIPICLEKTRWTTVAILAVLKAGSAFVLFDPSHPTKRLKEACDDVQAKIMITSTRQNIPLATQQLTSIIVDITDSNPQWRHNSVPTIAPPSSVKSTNALWCAFTSGSTGRPKGMVLKHVALCSLMNELIEKARLTSKSRVLQFSSYAFDAAVADNLATLLAGGCICVPSEWERREDLAGAITRMQVNWTFLTPTVLRTIDPLNCPTLETVLLGGEAMSIREVQAWEHKVNLMNVYGPAEACVYFTLQTRVTATSDLRNIGCPMAGDCWVVNPSDHNKLVPIGGIGELVLGGPRIGRGYINNPAANEAAFITNLPPWFEQFRKNATDSRLYKTGDLVQYGVDGSLRFIGRKDFQVKIRGQRVEISDIEMSIQQAFPQASGVVVELVKSNEDASHNILTAFLEVKHNCGGDLSSCQNLEGSFFVSPCSKLQTELGILEKNLQECLPLYMIPGRLLVVRQLPTNPSGKTDRRPLREQASSLSPEKLAWLTSGTKKRLLPSTPMEEVVLQACAEALEIPVENIGMDDSFFHLGGDSILAIKFASKARENGIIFRVVDIFQHPKLMDLAAIACTKQPLQDSVELGPIQQLLPEPISPEDAVNGVPAFSDLPLSPENVQNVLPVTGSQLLRLHEPFQYFILQASGIIDAERLNVACQSLVNRHEILRTIFRKCKSTWVQIVLKQLELPVVQYETDDDSLIFVEDICDADNTPIPPIDIPLVQFFLVRGSNESSSLVIRLSHALYDGYSWKILCRDLEHLYNNIPLGVPIPYSVHVQQWARAQVNQKALEYWRNYLKDSQMSRIGDIGIDITLAESTHPYMITTETEIPLLKPPANITMATVIKAAWALTLARFTGTSDVAFGLTTSGRNLDTLATNELVGLCINQIPVRVHTNSISTHTIHDLLQSIQDQFAESLAYELVEFSNILSNHSNHEKTQAQASSFGTVLIFQNTHALDQPLRLGTATCSWVPISFGPLRTRDCVEVEVTPNESEGRLNICLGAPNTIWTRERAEEVLRVFSRCIELLGEDTKVCLGELGF